MGLDVGNGWIGDFHLSWTGTRWFSTWCKEHDLPDPFIGWMSGDNSGDQCVLGPDNEHTRLAKEWCRALEEKQPKITKLGNGLLEGMDIIDLLFPGKDPIYPDHYLSELLSGEMHIVARWYAILKHGVEHGDTLEYW